MAADCSYEDQNALYNGNGGYRRMAVVERYWLKVMATTTHGSFLIGTAPCLVQVEIVTLSSTLIL